MSYRNRRRIVSWRAKDGTHRDVPQSNLPAIDYLRERVTPQIYDELRDMLVEIFQQYFHEGMVVKPDGKSPHVVLKVSTESVMYGAQQHGRWDEFLQLPNPILKLLGPDGKKRNFNLVDSSDNLIKWVMETDEPACEDALTHKARQMSFDARRS